MSFLLRREFTDGADKITEWGTSYEEISSPSKKVAIMNHVADAANKENVLDAAAAAALANLAAPSPPPPPLAAECNSFEMDMTFSAETAPPEVNHSLNLKPKSFRSVITKSPMMTRSKTNQQSRINQSTVDMDITQMNSMAINMSMVHLPPAYPTLPSSTIYNEDISSFMSAIDSIRLSPAVCEQQQPLPPPSPPPVTGFDISIDNNDGPTESLLTHLNEKADTKYNITSIIEETMASVAISCGGGKSETTTKIDEKQQRQVLSDRTQYFFEPIVGETSLAHKMTPSPTIWDFVNKTINKTEFVDETCIVDRQPNEHHEASNASDRMLIDSMEMQTEEDKRNGIDLLETKVNCTSILIDDTIGNVPLNLLSSTKMPDNFYATTESPPRYSPINESFIANDNEQTEKHLSAHFERTIRQIDANNESQLNDDINSNSIRLVTNDASSSMGLYGATQNNTTDLWNLTAGEIYNNNRKKATATGTDPNVAPKNEAQVLIRINNDHLHLSRNNVPTPSSLCTTNATTSINQELSAAKGRRLSFQCRKCKSCKRSLSLLERYSVGDVSCVNTYQLDMWCLEKYDGTATPLNVLRASAARDRRRDRNKESELNQNVWSRSITFLLKNKRLVFHRFRLLQIN